MAGLFTYAIGGGGLLLIGASESIISTSETLKQISQSTSLSPSSNRSKNSKSNSKSTSKSFITSLTFVAISLISFLFILNSLISIIDAIKSKDQTGVVLQLEVISISAVFLLFSVLGIFRVSVRFRFPSLILNTICLFGFVEEFFLFYIQKKDPDGIENRYYDLLLVPICVCIVSTVLELKSPRSSYSRLGRGVGLVLQGMWFVQMGISFYSGLISDGCFVRAKSRGNFTVRCKGHPEFHRARSIATLQFNCHLALVVCFVAGVYGFLSAKHGVSRESVQYKPIGDELQRLDLDQTRFTLDSEDDDDVGDGNGNGGVEDKESVVVEKSNVIINGYASEFHRARVIATLQFNCHLALVVCFVAGVYSFVSRKHGMSHESMQYKLIVFGFGSNSIHLDSEEEDDDDDGGGGGGGGVKENVFVEKSNVINRYGSDH
ncbi:hypothetical protein OSB04_000306 [Centaurea solstitialis]|uniref:Transmembrane protein n=1 Tax=Centaurea solstitialis TaxID=347529 RepID=A0AA38U0J0_9ASTR|nr:hypothetical protein OSB04_000306 [Centaurea solstitialis]